MSAGAREPVGSLAEEAARLFEALQGWAHSATDDLPFAGDDPECRLCPVCQLVRALRGVRPETVEHLVAATGSLAAAMRSVLGEHAHTGPQGARPPSRVQHIDIT